ncbi:hypothetical protein A2U01_0008664, partial [Trifolium medium]|nr:hypothetical protein [Trifolium medium]
YCPPFIMDTSVQMEICDPPPFDRFLRSSKQKKLGSIKFKDPSVLQEGVQEDFSGKRKGIVVVDLDSVVQKKLVYQPHNESFIPQPPPSPVKPHFGPFIKILPPVQRVCHCGTPQPPYSPPICLGEPESEVEKLR